MRAHLIPNKFALAAKATVINTGFGYKLNYLIVCSDWERLLFVWVSAYVHGVRDGVRVANTNTSLISVRRVNACN